MAVRKRYPSIRVDLSDLGSRPRLDGWVLVPETRGDGAILVGRIYGDARTADGTIVTTPTVQALDDVAGWAWTYGLGLLRLGPCGDPVASAAVEL